MIEPPKAVQSPHLSSLAEGYRALVVGAGGGIGAGIVAHLLADPHCARVYAASRAGHPVGAATVLRMDVLYEASIKAGFDAIEGELDLIIVATGVLHGEGFAPEKAVRQISSDALAHVFAVNVTGPALVAKYGLDRLSREGKTVFAALSARVGSISDNRLGGWHAYRASKAALNMLIRNFAIETARRRPKAVIVGLHPGTVDTGLSKPFQTNVADAKLFAPAYSSACLLNVLDGLGAGASGSVFAWDGSRVPE